MIPACGFDSSFDGTFGFAGVGFEEVECPAAQGGEVFGSVAGAGAALVFAEDDVEPFGPELMAEGHPVELIFDAPVAAHGASTFSGEDQKRRSPN